MNQIHNSFLRKAAFKLSYSSFSFEPSLISTLLTVILIPVFIKFGCWQWDRAEKNQETLQAYELKIKKEAIGLPPLSQFQLNMRFFPVKTIGYYDNTHTYLLDNAIYKNKVGYRVLTIFYPKNNPAALIVDRGFIPIMNQRKILPFIQPIFNERMIEGILDNPSQPAYTFTEKTSQAPTKLLQRINLEQLKQIIGRPIYPLILIATNGEEKLLQTKPKPPDKFLMHRGYALQWFTFAATLFIIYIVLNFNKK